MYYKQFNDYELLYLMDESDEVARSILKKKYMPFIYIEASSYYKKLKTLDLEGLSFDELISIGIETLLQVSKYYDENKNVLFYTYFSHCLSRSFSSYRRKLLAKKNQSMFHYQEKDYAIEDILVSSDFQKKLNPFHLYEQCELENNIYQFIIDLDGIERSVFELYYNGFDYKEISILLEITVPKIGRVVRKLREKIKKKLKKEII